MNRLLRAFAEVPIPWSEAAEYRLDLACDHSDSPPKVLLVVAHPDDESECAATIYRITHELRGIVDQAVVTNGEAGLEYCAPAEAYYGFALPNRAFARKHLPKIRRQELLRAGKILGIRRHYFLEQRDTGFTLDPYEALRQWDVALVRRKLRHLLEKGKYDFVLTALPTRQTHGHHQSVAVLLLEAAEAMDYSQRPAILGVQSGWADQGPRLVFSGLPEFAVTRTASSDPAWILDRTARFARCESLDYSIVVHWVMAEHKSQGMFQMEYGRKTHEWFWLFASSGEGGMKRWQQVVERIGNQSPRSEGGYASLEKRRQAVSR